MSTGWGSNAGNSPSSYVPGSGLPLDLLGQPLQDSTGPVRVPATETIAWTGRAQLTSPSDGVVQLTPTAGSVSIFQFGGATSAFPALKRSGTTLAARLADDTGDAPFAAKSINLSGVTGELQFAGNTVLESDGSSVYLSPSNDSTGSVVVYTGGSQRIAVSSVGLVTLSGNLALPTTGRLTFGTDATGSQTADQAVTIGNVDARCYAAGPSSLPHNFGYNAIVMGSGALIMATGGSADDNMVLGNLGAAFGNAAETAVSGGNCFRNTVIGAQFACAQGYRNIAVGNGASAAGVLNIVIGDYASVGGGAYGGASITTTTSAFQNSVAIGRSASVQHNFSVALGKSATTTADHQLMLGTSAEIVVAPGGLTLTGTKSQATGTLTLTGLPTAAQTFTIAGVTMTAVASGATTNQFNIGVDATTTAANIVTAVNSVALSTLSNTVVTAANVGGVVTFTAGAYGALGNALTLTTALSNSSVSGATLTGGALQNSITGGLTINGGSDSINITSVFGHTSIVMPAGAMLAWGSVNDLSTTASNIYLGSVHQNSINGGAGFDSIVIGSQAYIAGGGDRNIAIGQKTFIYSGLRSVVIGSNAAAASDRGVAIGFNAGSAAVGVGQFGIAIGNNSVASGASSTTVGASATTVSFTTSTALGAGATATANNQIMLGTSAETVAMPGKGAFANGLVGSPSATFIGDTTSGMWLNSGTALAFSYLGVQRLSLGTSIILTGNVAVGGNVNVSGQVGSTSGGTLAAPGLYTSNTGASGFYGVGGASSNIIGVVTAGTLAGSVDASQNWSVAPATSNYLQIGSTSKLLAPADGTLQLTSSAGTFGTFILGGTTASTGVKLVSSNGALTLTDGANSGVVAFNITASAGVTAMTTLGQVNFGEVTVNRTTGDAFRFAPAVNGRLSSDSQFGWSSGSGLGTVRDVSFFRSAAGVIGVNNGSGTSPNGSMALDTLTANAVAPSAINPSTYYTVEEYERSTTSYSVGGANGTNYNIAIPNSISSTFFGTSNLGGVYLSTSTSSQGGYLIAGMSLNIVKSSTIKYQWRHLFYVGTLSDATNPYTLLVGSMVMGASTTGALPFTGPYLSYTHGTNSGQWVMGSATASTQITANTTTAVTTGWHNVTITLNNGVYTFVLDGVSVGTVTDTNMATTSTNNQGASIGGIALLPNGAFTTSRYAAIDRSDLLVTGLAR